MKYTEIEKERIKDVAKRRKEIQEIVESMTTEEIESELEEVNKQSVFFRFLHNDECKALKHELKKRKNKNG